MKIIYLHQYFNSPDMPGGTRSYEMAKMLVKWGHEVHIVTSYRKVSQNKTWFIEKIDGVTVHWLPVKYSNKMGFTSRMVAFITFALLASKKAYNLKGDVVFATSTPLTICIPGIVASKLNKIPMVFEIRDLWPDVPIALGFLKNRVIIKIAKWLESFAYKSSSRVIALAPGMADGVSATGYDAKRIAIIPNGCDLELFNTELVSSFEGDNCLIVLYMGAIGPANGVDFIPHLASALISQFSETGIKFVIAGDGRCLDSVKQLTKELEVEEIVSFLGAIPKKDIPAWTNKCSATIMTYTGPEVLYRDSVSNKFFDSLAAGKPIFANFKGFSTLVAQSAGCATILPERDFTAAAYLLRKQLKDCVYRDRSRLVAKELATQYFDRIYTAKLLENILLQTVNDIPPSETCIGDEYRELWDKARG